MTNPQSVGPQVVDWRPGGSDAFTWNIFGVLVAILGIPLFSLPVLRSAGRAGGSFTIGGIEIAAVLLLTAGLVACHEAIHGLTMLGFGARPRFGATLIGRVVPALYATAEGHRFTRLQYLVVALSPALSISVVGFVLCLGPWGGLLVLPLALHLGGCVGDACAALRVLREPRGSQCEDLRDGLRFHRPRG